MCKRIASTINKPIRCRTRICTVLERIRNDTCYVPGNVVRRILAQPLGFVPGCYYASAVGASRRTGVCETLECEGEEACKGA